MNKINHKPAQDIICDIILRIKKQVENALNYKKQKVTLETDERLNTEYREGQIKAINEKYLAELQETRAFIAEKLGAVAEIEKENESILDFDVPEFSETMAAVNAAKGKLPEAVIYGIRDKFKGNYQVMATIKAALEGFEIDLKPYKFNDYTAPAEECISQMIINAGNIETSADTSFISLGELLDEIVYFAECRGMVFGDDFKTFDPETAGAVAEVKDAIQTQTARQAMGLA